MFKPEAQQIEICLLKSNLDEIENDLVLQRSALPALDAENERKYRETMTALRVVRSLNFEIERLKLENVRLTSKRMQMKRQADDIAKSIEQASAAQNELKSLLKEEEQGIEMQVRQYEDALEEIAERFRKTRGYYNEEEMNMETEKVNAVITKLTNEVQKRQTMIDEIKHQFEMLQPDIPENLCTVILKEDLDTQVKELTEKCEVLLKKRNSILNKKTSLGL